MSYKNTLFFAIRDTTTPTALDIDLNKNLRETTKVMEITKYASDIVYVTFTQPVFDSIFDSILNFGINPANIEYEIGNKDNNIMALFTMRDKSLR